MDRLLDTNRNCAGYLAIPEAGQMVADEIHAGNDRLYELHAWVVMPNHVHMLFTTRRPLSGIMAGLKGRTARQVNQFLRREGKPIWQSESYDRLVRNRDEFEKIRTTF